MCTTFYPSYKTFLSLLVLNTLWDSGLNIPVWCTGVLWVEAIWQRPCFALFDFNKAGLILKGEQTLIFFSLHSSKKGRAQAGKTLWVIHHLVCITLALNWGQANKTDKCRFNIMWLTEIRSDLSKKNTQKQKTWVTSVAERYDHVWCRAWQGEPQQNSDASSCSTYCKYTKLPWCTLKHGHHSSCPSGPRSSTG